MDVQVVRRAAAACRGSTARADGHRTDVNHVRVADRCRSHCRCRPTMRSTACAAEAGDGRRSSGPNAPARPGRYRRMEHRDQPGDVGLHDLFEHDVGLVQPGLGQRALARRVEVVDLHRQRRPQEHVRMGDDEAGQRGDGPRSVSARAAAAAGASGGAWWDSTQRAARCRPMRFEPSLDGRSRRPPPPRAAMTTTATRPPPTTRWRSSMRPRAVETGRATWSRQSSRRARCALRAEGACRTAG